MIPFDQLLSEPLLMIGGTPISVATIIIILIVLAATILCSRLLRSGVERILLHRGGKEASVGAISALTNYAVLVIGFSIALQTAGINLTALFAAGAVFAIGLGFAMQSLAQVSVAGVILLLERSIRPGDVLDVEGTVVKVKEMGLRSSIAETRDGENLVIPNAILIQGMVKNFTYNDEHQRLKVAVGVSYGSDMSLVRATLSEVAERLSKKWKVQGRLNQVIMTGFGDNSVNWELSAWVSDPWTARKARSEILETVWEAFQSRSIVIAFPQVDVHLDHEVTANLAEILAGERPARLDRGTP